MAGQLSKVHKRWVATFLLAGLLSCGASADQGLSVDRIIVCKTVDEANRPIDEAKIFLPGDDFYCSLHLTNIPDGVPVAIRWYHDKDVIKSDGFVTHAAPDANLYFSVPSPDTQWPVGTYRADVLIDKAVAATLPFTVSNDPAAQVIDLCMARDISHQTLEPVDRTDTYDGTSRFYCSLKLDSPKVGEDVELRWMHGDSDLLKDIHTATHVRCTHYLAFALDPKGKWTPGPYHVELLVDGKSVRSLTFQVH